MCPLSRGLGVSAFLVLGVLPPLAAQRVISPDSLRYPTIMDSTAQVRLEAVVRLRVAELARAIQRADTLMLIQVLGDAEIPAAEVALARSRGCPSVGWALTELRRRFGRDGESASIPLGSVILQVRVLGLGLAGNQVVDLRLLDVQSMPQRFGDVRLVFGSAGDALVAVSAAGLQAALCGMAQMR